jgi:hypothetical protein
MQQDFTIWKNLLDMSGGALSQQKCNFYILSWEFFKFGIPFSKETSIEHLTLSGIGWDITRVQESHQTLCKKVLHTNPIKAHYSNGKKLKKDKKLIRSNDMSYNEIEKLYQRIYLPKVRYFLPFTSLPEKVFKNITKQNIVLLLRECGYAQTMSRDIVFGNKSLGGLGWCDMEVEQRLQNLGAMINGLHNNEIIGQVHKAMMRTWFWALGMNPLKNEIPNITHDESLWPRTTAQFMSKHNIRIVLANPIYPQSRGNNQYKMTLAYNLPFTAYALKYINYCRLFLIVISIADLTDASGKYVASEMYQVERNSSNKSDSICVQRAPQAFKTRFWHKFSSHITIPKRQKLKAPLGRWIVPSDQIRQKYNAYWNTTKVYKREDHGITRYKHNMSSFTCKVDQVDNIPVDAFPFVITLRNEIISDISGNFIEQTLCEQKPYVDEGIIEVTNASVIGERGTWAAIVTIRNGKEFCRDQGLMICPNLSSYRSELQCCKGSLPLLNKFDKDTPWVLLCDNMSEIQSLNKLRSHLPNVNQSDYDVLLEIKELIQPIIVFQHVKGNQGTELSDEFDLQTNLNILMDTRAKRMQQEVQHKYDWTHQNKYQIIYNNETINGNMNKSLRQKIGSTQFRLHYRNKFKEKYGNILWESFTFACQNGNHKKGVLKMIHNIAPTQITLYKRHLSHDTVCTICRESEETLIHNQMQQQ